MKTKGKPQASGRKAYGPKNWAKPQAAKPSPLPWAAFEGDYILIMDADGYPENGVREKIIHATCGNDETAALIVRAVNGRAGLVEALSRSLRAIEWSKTEERMTPTEHADMLRAALRAAGEAV
jgi:hypothetical protein